MTALDDPYLTQERVARARQALEHLREIRSPSRTGCAWCGISHSASWHRSPWSWPGNDHGNHQAYLCDPCGRRWRSSRCTVAHWRPHLAAEWLGLEVTPIEFGVTELPSFRETHPADRTGTARRFQYLEEAS